MVETVWMKKWNISNHVSLKLYLIFLKNSSVSQRNHCSCCVQCVSRYHYSYLPVRLPDVTSTASTALHGTSSARDCLSSLLSPRRPSPAGQAFISISGRYYNIFCLPTGWMSLTVDPLVPVRVVVEIAEVILPGHLKISSFTLEIPQTTSHLSRSILPPNGSRGTQINRLALLEHVSLSERPESGLARGINSKPTHIDASTGESTVFPQPL